MEVIKYILQGDPVPLARPRVSGANRNIYDSQKLLKRSLLFQLMEQHGSRPPYSGPCHLDAVFYMKMPKGSISKTAANVGKPHIFKPDTDNLIKLICDICCMSEDGDGPGVLLNDDCVVFSITAKKLYDVNPRTEFTITEINEKKQ
ncbi:MAG TPA: RusA family crossover junction endodeoxyribonuclease [Candidatus Babeliaceae bacterium]|nr:RusA family crossover junction endodeoxyribonuclease [Candidatus Babeliaceae bacterium]